MRRLALIGLLALSAIAQDLTQVKPTGYLSDFAGVVDGASRASIERYLAAVEKATGAEIAIVTVQTLNGDPIEDYANKLYRAWGIGKKGKNEGALFLFSIGDRKSRLEVGYGLEGILPDGSAGGILREMRPALRAGQYGPAFIEAARQIGGKIATEKNVTIPESLPPPAFANGSTGRGGREIPPAAIIIGIVVLFLILSNLGGGGRGRRGGMPWFIPIGGYSSGGGGFGGSSSGSSWGGFGGGDSGGGGASSDW